MDEQTFHSIWGTDGVAPPADETGTSVLDPQAFESQWLTPKSEKPQSQAEDIGQGRAEGVQFLRGVPIAGAYADKAAAALNAAAAPLISTPGMSNAPTFGERMSENEKRIKAGADKYAAEHPVAAGIEQFAGGTAAMGPLAATATGARALGLTGGLIQRGIAGGLSGAAIGGADTAARTGDIGQAGLGAAIGGGFGGLPSTLAARYASHRRFAGICEAYCNR
jgi:hypothetical protein